MLEVMGGPDQCDVIVDGIIELLEARLRLSPIQTRRLFRHLFGECSAESTEKSTTRPHHSGPGQASPGP